MKNELAFKLENTEKELREVKAELDALLEIQPPEKKDVEILTELTGQ